MKTHIHSLVYTIFILIAGTITLTAAPALLGNKVLSGQQMDADTVKAVLLGKKVTIGNDRVIIVVIKESAAQDSFLKARVGMSTDQFQTYWRRLYMTGGGSAPKVVDSEEAAIKLVAESPGAITVGDSANTSGLVVLSSE